MFVVVIIVVVILHNVTPTVLHIWIIICIVNESNLNNDGELKIIQVFKLNLNLTFEAVVFSKVD